MSRDWNSRAASRWARFWMRFASLSRFGRIATRIATAVPLPYVEYYEEQGLAHLSEFGYVAGSVRIHHNGLKMGPRVFINDHVNIIRGRAGGEVNLGERVWLGEGCRLSTGQHGSTEIGAYTSIGPGSNLVAYLSTIKIGSHCMIGPDCHFYPYNHGIAPGVMMQQQPLQTKGDIVLGDDVWVGRGATILSRVRIGKGAVIGAGAVVTGDVPAGSVVAGNPARVVRHRESQKTEATVSFTHDPPALIVRRLDGTIEHWNQDACSLYGWQPEEAMARRTHSLLSTKFPQPLGLIEGELSSRGHWEGTLIHTRRDGAPVIVNSRWKLCVQGRNEVNVLETNRPA